MIQVTPDRLACRSTATRGSALLITAMSSISIAVAMQTTTSVVPGRAAERRNMMALLGCRLLLDSLGVPGCDALATALRSLLRNLEPRYPIVPVLPQTSATAAGHPAATPTKPASMTSQPACAALPIRDSGLGPDL